jgi:hypothetical protein
MTATAPAAPARKKKVSIAAVNKLVTYAPHQVQREVHHAQQMARFRVVCAGRRTGKSTLGGHELTHEAFRAKIHYNELSPKGKRMEYWIVGPNYTDAEKEFRVLYNDILKLGIDMDKPGTYYDANGGNMNLSLLGGRYLVKAKSAAHETSLVGESLTGIILAEAAKLKPVVWTKYLRPTLADYARDPRPSWALMTSTPEGKNWFYDQYMRGISTDADNSSWYGKRMPSWANDIVFPEGRYDPEILDMSKDMSEEKFKQEIGAEFTEFVGRVFKRFNEEDNVKSIAYDPKLPTFIAEDSGYTNPSVALFLQVDAWGNVYVVGEYYQRHRTPEEFAADVLADTKLGPMARAARLLYADPADPGTAATLANKWLVSSQSGTGGTIQERLDLIRRWLVPGPAHLEDGHADKKPKFFVDSGCVNLIREMNDYRYPESKSELTAASENPLKKDDHTPEALGRFFRGHFGKQFSERHRARQSKATMKRSR